MNKPITMIVRETESQLIKICNESGLSPIILDLIVQGLYSKVHTLAEKQTMEEELIYINAMNEASNKNESLDNNN